MNYQKIQKMEKNGLWRQHDVMLTSAGHELQIELGLSAIGRFSPRLHAQARGKAARRHGEPLAGGAARE
jgi:hypothetical protein